MESLICRNLLEQCGNVGRRHAADFISLSKRGKEIFNKREEKLSKKRAGTSFTSSSDSNEIAVSRNWDSSYIIMKGMIHVHSQQQICRLLMDVTAFK
jgi:hypothetical protein